MNILFVNSERDRRIANGFEFGGREYQDTIAGFASLKSEALVEIIMPSGKTFEWIDASNNVVTLTAQEALALTEAAFDFRTTLYKKCRAIKDMKPLPDKIEDDKYWI